MPKRYFCDYCDRYISNNKPSIKRHNNSGNHLQTKRAWYSRFGPNGEDIGQVLCRDWQRIGACVYGGSCRFAHFLPDRESSSDAVTTSQRNSKGKFIHKNNSVLPPSLNWILTKDSNSLNVEDHSFAEWG
mmetsp:Transcript_21347/g.29655  ORF Transcript_21347/g.29655 Transcript_21347/m.29655 type:complete len:130 (-) Transcript_21347:88-477(-)